MAISAAISSFPAKVKDEVARCSCGLRGAQSGQQQLDGVQEVEKNNDGSIQRYRPDSCVSFRGFRESWGGCDCQGAATLLGKGHSREIQNY
jgi:hypothetical protein